MNDKLTFVELCSKVFDEIIELAEGSQYCTDYDCIDGSLELFTSRGVLLITKKSDVMELWVSSLAIGAEYFSMDSSKGCFSNRKGEELTIWVGKFLSL